MPRFRPSFWAAQALASAKWTLVMRQQVKKKSWCCFKVLLKEGFIVPAVAEASKETPLAFCGDHQLGHRCTVSHARCYLTAISACFVDTQTLRYTSALATFPPLQKHFPSLISVDGIKMGRGRPTVTTYWPSCISNVTRSAHAHRVGPASLL